MERFAIDTDYYTSGTSDYPDLSGELAESGRFRLQPVARTDVYPFVYNPGDNSLTVYTSTILTVTFTVPGPNARKQQEI
jgi:hypothetical protein